MDVFNQRITLQANENEHKTSDTVNNFVTLLISEKVNFVKLMYRTNE